jgi:hypothetical protein
MTATASPDAVKTQVLSWSAIYGELDGENNYSYAKVMAEVYQTLTTDQKTKLFELRKSIMSGTYSDGTPFDFSTVSDYYLFSAVIQDTTVLTPYIGNTDWLFFEP